MASIALLLFWIFAQANITAHELAIDHSLDSHCEWQCKSSKQDDLLPAAIETSFHSALFSEHYPHITVYYLADENFYRPFLRGPPHLI